MQGQTGSVILVICLAALIGLGVPAMLWAGLRRGGPVGQIELMKRASRRAGSPWKPEDSKLTELHRLVEKLRKRN